MIEKINKEDIEKIKIILGQMPVLWDGKDAILEMKKSDFNQWRQMEWIGFYFEFLCQKYFKDVMKFHKIIYGNVTFDGFLRVPFDFKAHTLNTGAHQVIINDTEATINAVEDYGSVVVIIALGKVRYDDARRTFQKWHEELKGGKSYYELERIKRGASSRLRKCEFRLKDIIIIKIDKSTLKKCGSFQKNFRNADGSLRRSKVLLNLEELDKNEVIEQIRFE